MTKRPESLLDLIPAVWQRGHWPSHIWIGVTIENQAQISRLDTLAEFRAAATFVSFEPLLGEIDLEPLFGGEVEQAEWLTDLGQVIIGGESGPGARPCHIEWIRSLVRQCQAAGVPVFVKQLGARPFLNGARINLHSRKGADISEWPEDLRVQEFTKN